MTTDDLPRIQARGVTKIFAGVPALDHVQLTLHAGEVVGLLGENGAASFTQDTPSQVRLVLNSDAPGRGGYRTVNLGAEHPYLAGGIPMDSAGVGFGQNECFAFQARAFLEEVAGNPEEQSLPRNASFDEGVHNMQIMAAVAASAADNGKKVTL